MVREVPSERTETTPSTIPIEDAAPSQVVLMTRTTDPNPLIPDFHTLATRSAPG
ncbi:hypothetical protein GCM10009828_008150 [Actinoplanes couchii]|uniref:Uncharacterized protein n=1 Tax=Actinoplanes couchii TaxID=403638 RepID=A0ABQ3XPA0_9ACTN|nr:hypothetical protein Aco03nite_087440 [Actinoplanes couchii]